MLVLSRKVGQEIVIGDNITVVVNKIQGNRVTLGIEAPDDVNIYRGELEPLVLVIESDSISGEQASNESSSELAE